MPNGAKVKEVATNTLGKFGPFANLSAVALTGALLWLFVREDFKRQDIVRTDHLEEIKLLRDGNAERFDKQLDRFDVQFNDLKSIQRDNLEASRERGRDTKLMVKGLEDLTRKHDEFTEWCKKNWKRE